MGPAATVDFLNKIVLSTPAGTDQEHVPIILHGVPQIPDRSSAIESGSDAPFLPMLAGLRMLERNGADVIAIPCNTAHHWYDRLARTTAIDIIHIADAVRDELVSRKSLGAVALLATRGTIASGLYQTRLAGTVDTVVVPDEHVQQLVDASIAAIKAGDERAGGAAGEAAVLALIESGVEFIILACTELPMALRHSQLTAGVIDSTVALARACVIASMAVSRAPLARAG